MRPRRDPGRLRPGRPGATRWAGRRGRAPALAVAVVSVAVVGLVPGAAAAAAAGVPTTAAAGAAPPSPTPGPGPGATPGGSSGAGAVSACEVLNPLLQPACRLAAPRLGVPGTGSHGAGVALTGPGVLLGGVAGAVTDTVGDSAMAAVTRFVVDGAKWFLDRLAEVLTRSASVRVSTAWFGEQYRVMAAVAAAMCLLFLLLTAASALLHRDPGRVARGVAMVVAAGLGTGAAVTITQLLLTVTDELSAALAAGTATDLHQALDGAGAALIAASAATGPDPGVPLFAALLGGLLAAVAAAVIWIELLLREVAIHAALLFFPLALAGLAWEPGRAWARRLAEILAALIFAKFVIVAVLSLAAAGLAGGEEQDGGVLAGAGLLVVAAFAPFLLLRLIGVVEVAAAAAVLEGARQRGTRPLVTGGHVALYTLARHRAHAAPRAVPVPIHAAGPGGPGGIIVSGPGGPPGGPALPRGAAR